MLTGAGDALSENLRVLGGLVVGILIAVSITYLAAERPFSFSLVDSECENAQQQYYDARNRARVDKNQNPAAQNDYASNERDHANVCAEYRMADAAERGFWVLIVTLLFTGGAAVAAWRTVHTMRDTAKRELRAHVHYDHGVLKGIFGVPGNEPMVWIRIQNFGQTPAYRSRARFEVARIAWPPTEDSFVLRNERQQYGVVAPHHHFTMIRRFPETVFPPDTLELLRRGEVAIFVFGEIEYDDAFGDAHTTTFRVLHGGSVGMRTDGVLAAHEGGNDAD